MPSRRLPRVLAALGVGVTLTGVAAFVVATNAWMSSASGGIATTPAETPTRAVAIVPGGSLWRGKPGTLLEDRLRTALALYREGRVRAILVSGNGAGGETQAMASWLVSHDVRREDVLSDPGGVRTLETARRASALFGVTSATVCTQRSHMNRALFLTRHAGIDAVGAVGTIDVAPTVRLRGIEALKSSLAFLEVFALGKTRSTPAASATALASR